MPIALLLDVTTMRRLTPLHHLISFCALSLGIAACTGNLGEKHSNTPVGSHPIDPEQGMPSAVVMRRLNRQEYLNTVQDLLFFSERPQGIPELPEDIQANGFDRDGAAQTLSVSSVKLYEDAAAWLVAKALEPNSPSRGKLVLCDVASGGDACFRSIIQSFARRAFRRPVEGDEVDRLLSLAKASQESGETVETSLALVFQAALLNPHFLFRVELEPSQLGVFPVGPYELASRLSYFLWSTMPDETLLGAAASGELNTAEGLLAQTRRMLADQRSAALAADLGGQWLNTRRLVTQPPDVTKFPTFSSELSQAMTAESETFFKHLIDTDAPISDLLTTKYGFVNASLSRHYGLASVSGSALQKVEFNGDERGGLLGQAAWLTVTSFTDRASSTKRGSWLTDHLLCTPPTPAPPEVAAIIAMTKPEDREALRAQRKSNPACASCHATFEEYGAGLAKYDGIGAFHPDVASIGNLLTGETVTGRASLAQVVVKDPRLGPCVTRAFMTYALGRGLTSADAPFIQSIAESVDHPSELRMKQLIERLVLSDSFRFRQKAEGETKL